MKDRPGGGLAQEVEYWESDLYRTALHNSASCALNNTRGTLHIRVFVDDTPSSLAGCNHTWWPWVLVCWGVRVERIGMERCVRFGEKFSRIGIKGCL